MNPNRKTYDSEFKKHIVLELLNSGNPQNLKPVAAKYGLDSCTLARWKDLYLEFGEKAFDLNRRRNANKDRIAELERRNAELEEELEILKKAAAFLADVVRK